MRFKAVFIKESILIARDKRALFLMLVFPVFMLILYGYGVTFDIDNVPVAVLDYCHNPESRNLINKLNSSGYLSVRYVVSNYDEISNLFLDNKIMLAFVIPSDFNVKGQNSREYTLQVLANGSDANTANVALGYQAAIIASYSSDILMEKIARQGLTGTAFPGISDQIRIWYNPEMKSAYSIVPGVIAIVMMLLASLLTSNSIVREKETGTIEMLVSTPIKSWELVLGKVLPYILVSFIDIIIVVLIGHFCLGVPIRGSLMLLLFGSLLFLICALGLGLLASTLTVTVSSSQILTLLIALLPSILLSGFIFPIESMPDVVQAITYIVPARYFIVILRGIFLKGTGIAVLWTEYLFLFVFGLIILSVSVLKFRKAIG